MEWSFQRLFLMDKDSELPWLSYQHFGNLVGNLTDMIVEEQNWQPMIDEIWNNRQVADYTGKNINKRDFLRSWNHSRTAEHISLEDMLENGASINGEQLYDIADPRGEFESTVLTEQSMKQFKDKLTEQDRKILQLRYEGYSLKEIAEKTGFKSPSALRSWLGLMKISFPGSTAISWTSTQLNTRHFRQSRFFVAAFLCWEGDL